MVSQRTRAPREVEKFRELARNVVNRHFGRTGPMKYLSGGLTNFVFAFKADGSEFVIRISPDAGRINGFIKEQWATTKAKEAGIPVPEILEVGSEMIGLPYMITRAVDGQPGTDHPKRLEILKELGKLGAKINTVRTKGFGNTFDWSDNKLSQNATFKDWLNGEYDAEGKLELLERHKMIEPKRSKAIRKIFSEASRQTTKPVLNHADLRLKNVIADAEGTILALIDWEGCVSNIPAWELSLALHDLGVDGMQNFVEGYGIGPRKLEASMPLIRAFNITNYTSAVEIAAKDKKVLEHYRLRLKGLFDLFSI